MTQHEIILEAFRKNGNTLTLGQILQHPWGYEFRARATELRREGYTILCRRAKRPSDNSYLLISPNSDGQMAFA